MNRNFLRFIKATQEINEIQGRRTVRFWLFLSLLVGCLVLTTFPEGKSEALSTNSNNDPIFNELGDIGLQIASNRKLTTEVNQTVEDSNISLTIQDYYYFADKLHISFKVSSLTKDLTKDKRAVYYDRPDVFINGKPINYTSKNGLIKAGTNQYIGVMSINTGEELPEEFDFKLHYSRIFNQSGNWTFNFPVNEATGKNIKIVKSATYDDYSLTLQSIKFNQAETSVSFQSVEPIYNDLDFTLYADGIPLKLLSTYSHSKKFNNNRVIMYYNYRFAPVEKKAKEFVLMPYIRTTDKTTAYNKSEQITPKGLPIKMSDGSNGTITITKLELNDDNTRVYFKNEFRFPHTSKWPTDNLKLISSAGSELSGKSVIYKSKQENTYFKEFEPIMNRNLPLKVLMPNHANTKNITNLQIKITLPK